MIYIARRGDNIRRRKDGRYEARYKSGYKIDGTVLYKSVYGRTYTEVKEKRMQLLKQGSKDIKLNTPSKTIKNISEKWLDMKQTQVKQSTYAKYYDIVYKHIIPRLGYMKLNKINQSMINEYIKYLYQNGRKDNKGGLQAQSIEKIVGVLKQIFKYTKEENRNYFLDFNYCIPKINHRKIETLTRDEQERFMTYLIKHLDRLNLGLLISLLLGLRIGEVCALRYGDINQNKKSIMVRKTLQRIKNVEPNAIHKTIIIIDEPKSSASIREVPIKDHLLVLINKFSGSDNAYILTGSTIKYIEPRTLQNRFKRVLKTLKIKEVNYHTLRHTFATVAIESGCDAKTLSELLGHSDVQITLRTYVHSSYELKKINIENMPFYYA